MDYNYSRSHLWSQAPVTMILTLVRRILPCYSVCQVLHLCQECPSPNSKNKTPSSSTRKCLPINLSLWNKSHMTSKEASTLCKGPQASLALNPIRMMMIRERNQVSLNQCPRNLTWPTLLKNCNKEIPQDPFNLSLKIRQQKSCLHLIYRIYRRQSNSFRRMMVSSLMTPKCKAPWCHLKGILLLQLSYWDLTKALTSSL